jgi:hypothetical protein
MKRDEEYSPLSDSSTKSLEKRKSLARARAHEEDISQKSVKTARMIGSLLEAIDANDIQAIARVWREAMNADRRYWVDKGKNPKTGRAMGYWASEPDHKTRIAAANMMAAYTEGLPIQREVQLNANVDDLQQTIDNLKHSPAGQKMLEAMGMKDRINSLQSSL